jgi:hypothetical protein
MTEHSEFISRAALCRKLAEREPANRTFWMAEAENWSRLAKEKRHRGGSAEIESACNRADFHWRSEGYAVGQNRDAVQQPAARAAWPTESLDLDQPC